jgi:hypothetical protein
LLLVDAGMTTVYNVDATPKRNRDELRPAAGSGADHARGEKVPRRGDPVVHAAGGLRELVVDVHAARIAGLLDEMAALLQRKRTSPGSEGRKARVTYRYTTRRTRFWPRTPTEGGEERSVKRQKACHGGTRRQPARARGAREQKEIRE